MNKSAHTKKSLETYRMDLVYIYIYIGIKIERDRQRDGLTDFKSEKDS